MEFAALVRPTPDASPPYAELPHAAAAVAVAGSAGPVDGAGNELLGAELGMLLGESCSSLAGLIENDGMTLGKALKLGA